MKPEKPYKALPPGFGILAGLGIGTIVGIIFGIVMLTLLDNSAGMIIGAGAGIGTGTAIGAGIESGNRGNSEQLGPKGRKTLISLVCLTLLALLSTIAYAAGLF